VVDYRWELLVLTKGWSGAEFGAVFFNLGIASIIMPAPYRNCADRWINAEKLYGILIYFKWFIIYPR
jgi:hypothetical protein